VGEAVTIPATALGIILLAGAIRNAVRLLRAASKEAP
jgi:hypothetical protein